MDPNTVKLVGEAAAALGIAKFGPKVYEDVLQPAARQVGQELIPVAKAVKVALAPLRLSLWGWEQVEGYLKAEVAAKLAKKPEQEIKQPSTVIAGPVVMGMVFTANEPHLRQMYANLLAMAMHVPSARKAHPSFVSVIQQLSPEEALLLRTMASVPVDFSIDQESAVEPEHRATVRPNIALAEEWRKFCADCGLPKTDLADAYLNNLVRLGLLAHEHQVLSDPFAGITGLKTASEISVTAYGKLFLEACVKEV